MTSRKKLGESLNLEIDLIPESNSNRSGIRITPRFITIHNTDNTDFHGTLRNQRFKRWSQHEIESRVLDGNPRNSSEISPWRPTKSVRYVFSS